MQYYYEDLTRFRLLQEQAEIIRSTFERRYGFCGLPVPVEILLKALFGFRTETCALRSLHDQTAGALSVSERVIYVDERCTKHQYVFALAHEMGHLVLHHGKGSHIAENTLISQALASIGAKKAATQRYYMEKEADQFAAALLIPSAILLAEAKKYAVIDEYAVAEMTRKFSVSANAVVLQIHDLQKNLDWAGPSVDWSSLNRFKRSFEAMWIQRKKSAVPEALSFFDVSLEADDSRRADSGLIPKRHHKRPKIIEFAGTPNAGKDTEINILKTYLEDVHSAKVGIVQEADKSLDIDKPLGDILVYATVARVVDQLYEAYYENPGGCDYVIFNRGIFDRLAFLHFMRERGEISKEYERVNADYLLSKADLQNNTIVFLISPEESIAREEKSIIGFVYQLYDEFDSRNRNLAVSEQRIHSPLVLEQLNSCYSYAYNAYRELFKGEIYLSDCTNAQDLTVLEKARAVRTAVLPDRWFGDIRNGEKDLAEFGTKLPKQLRLAL